MVYLYVELRYHRQLNKICPDIPVHFFSAIGDAVRNNGGRANKIGHAMLYTFDRKSVGFAFSASRVLDEIRTLLEELRDRIREFFILVDATDSPLEPEVFKERLQNYDAILVPDESILFTGSALELLGSYVTTVPLAATGLEQYTGPKVTEYAIPEHNTDESFEPLILYTDGIHDPVKLIRDMLSTAPDIEIQTLLDEESLITYQENAAAKEVYSWFRYTPKQPDYRKNAVMAFFSQQLYGLSRVFGSPVPVRIVGKNPVSGKYSIVEELLTATCTVSGPERPQYLPSDIQSIPQDLLEMTYLIYRVQEYLYYDELPEFFQFLDKDSCFLISLGSWLYSFGVLSDPTDFRSIRVSLTNKIYERVGKARQKNDLHIAEFLWSKYESGLLMPTMELLTIFTELGYRVTDSFLIGCFFQNDIQDEAREDCLVRFSSDRVRQAVRKLAQGEKAAAEANFVQAESCAREVLHSFQREKIAYGECRSFSLLSQVARVKNKGDDAIAYLEYARENALRTRCSDIIVDVGIDLACVNFSVGSFDTALGAAESAERTAKKSFARDREIFLLFIKGRIFFETGDYHAAELLFQAAASLATLYHFPHQTAIARTWYGRVLTHQGRYHAAEQTLDEYSGLVPDASVFLLESAVLSGHHLNKAMPVAPGEVFRTQGPDSSGYSRIEDRSITDGVESYTASTAFKVLCLYYTARFGSSDDILESLSQLEVIAKEAYIHNDPHAAVYYYLCYELARHVPSVSPSDGTAFLSRGFKYLQTRAKEITDNTIREQYLRSPVWNSRLFRAAQENMLI